jgi:hypothetical protein
MQWYCFKEGVVTPCSVQYYTYEFLLNIVALQCVTIANNLFSLVLLHNLSSFL